MSSPSDVGILTSLRKYEALRASGVEVQRPEGSNIDVLSDPTTGKDIALCNINTLFPLTWRDNPILSYYENHVAIRLAAHHMNTGDGSLVPDIAGLPDRCPVRFTVSGINDDARVDQALATLIDETRRDDSTQSLPCAFIGHYFSSISIPAATVTGVLGFPQVSPGSTSPVLDDKVQFPLFGRTIPSDNANAIPLVIYLTQVLGIKHLAVLNINESYGNAFVDGIRAAAAIHSPDLDIAQIPVIDNPMSIKAAVKALKQTQFRYVFGLLRGSDMHDAVMVEAFDQGVAGNGLHNWFFGDYFPNLSGNVYEIGSPLHLVYRGVGVLKVTSGLPGMPHYDHYANKLVEIRNPTDLAYLNETVPVNLDQKILSEFLEDPEFMNDPHSFSMFGYEAAIALGLAACEAVSIPDREDTGNDGEKPVMTLNGKAHHAAMASLTFTGVTGTVAFNNVTASRDPGSAMFKVENYVPLASPDNSSEVIMKQVITDYMQDSNWTSWEPYIFNDGTSNIPADIAPPPEADKDVLSTALVAGGLGFVAIILGLVYLVIREKRKAQNDMWKVKKSELIFSDPPEVLGVGSFGLVLLAELRGTQVAVKRVIPPKDSRNGKMGSMFNNSADDAASTDQDLETGLKSGGLWSGMSSWGGMKSLQHKSIKNTLATKRNQSLNYKKLKEEFIEEMRYLAKLRHPCITTVMGAVIEKGEDPMLVLEFMDHGSLHSLLHNETMALDGEIIMPILRDVSQGLRFLHSADPQVIHGDLKSANILVDSRFRAKVADFGLSQKKNLGGTGTPFWMAPELLRKESTNTSASDVYSFGVILYEVYSRKDPYEGENAKDVLRAVADQHIRKRPAPPPHMPEKIKALMADCLEDDPLERPSFEEMDMRLKRINTEHDGTVGNRAKSQVSLFDIFPKHVAEALRDGRKVEAEHKDCVTIFFSDIVGFTEISSKLDPIKVANLLSRLYTKFDELAGKHDCYKVETIGDSYMAVTNLVKNQPNDHCKRIADFAVDAVAAANAVLIDPDDPSQGHVRIRVGFHSGPIVADVVGNRNPRYCLFGDTVNTASRMESNSGANRINCSERSAQLLGQQCPKLPLTSRGEVTIKGKGKLKCFWVNEAIGGKGTSSKVQEALERVRARQRMRISQLVCSDDDNDNNSNNNAQDVAIREQHPDSNTDGPGNVRTGASEAAGESEEMANLEENLKHRLSRHTTGSSTGSF